MMDHPMYTPCAEWAEKLAATHPDDLSPSDRVALDMHVASCPACAAVRTEYQAIDALILGLPGVEPVPKPSFAEEPAMEDHDLAFRHRKQNYPRENFCGMDKCPTCGAGVRPGDNFCLTCSNRLFPVASLYFKRVSFFADLPEEDIRALMSVAKRRTFRAGEVIFHRDDPGQVLYIIKEGKVKICINSPDGQEISLAVLGKGEYFGEFALLDGLPRSTDVIALEKVECYTLQRSDFHNTILKNPKIATQMLEALTKRLRNTDQMVEDLISLDVYGRVAKKLLELADAHGVKVENGIRIDVRLTQQELASMVGASRESVNKVLGYFTNKGYISSDKHKIALHRIEELKRRIY